MDRNREAILADYRSRFGGDTLVSPGWEAVDASLAAVYGGQEPQHWGTLIKYALGGPDPLDGISAYECRDGSVPHLHFCTYGYSSLYYDEESAGGEFNGFGFEMTLRLASLLPPTEPTHWVLNLLNNLARYVFQTGNVFGEGHWIPANGPIRTGYPTDLVGLVFLLDPALPPTDTPHGRVEYVQAFGITAGELGRVRGGAVTVADLLADHRQANPLLVTDLDRRDR